MVPPGNDSVLRLPRLPHEKPSATSRLFPPQLPKEDVQALGRATAVFLLRATNPTPTHALSGWARPGAGRQRRRCLGSHGVRTGFLKRSLPQLPDLTAVHSRNSKSASRPSWCRVPSVLTSRGRLPGRDQGRLCPSLSSPHPRVGVMPGRLEWSGSGRFRPARPRSARVRTPGLCRAGPPGHGGDQA